MSIVKINSQYGKNIGCVSFEILVSYSKVFQNLMADCDQLEYITFELNQSEPAIKLLLDLITNADNHLSISSFTDAIEIFDIMDFLDATDQLKSIVCNHIDSSIIVKIIRYYTNVTDDLINTLDHISTRLFETELKINNNEHITINRLIADNADNSVIGLFLIELLNQNPRILIDIDINDTTMFMKWFLDKLISKLSGLLDNYKIFNLLPPNGFTSYYSFPGTHQDFYTKIFHAVRNRSEKRFSVKKISLNTPVYIIFAENRSRGYRDLNYFNIAFCKIVKLELHRTDSATVLVANTLYCQVPRDTYIYYTLTESSTSFNKVTLDNIAEINLPKEVTDIFIKIE